MASSYDKYARAVVARVKFLTFLKKYRALFIIAGALLLGGGVTLGVISQSFTEEVEIKETFEYGERVAPTNEPKTSFGSFSGFEYYYEDLNEWNSNAPTLIGSYKVRALSGAKKSKEKSFSIIKKNSNVLIDQSSITYGEYPTNIKADLAYNDHIKSINDVKFNISKIDDGKITLSIDLSSISIVNSSGVDVTSFYNFETLEKELTINKKSLNIKPIIESKTYDKSPLEFGGSFTGFESKFGDKFEIISFEYLDSENNKIDKPINSGTYKLKITEYKLSNEYLTDSSIYFNLSNEISELFEIYKVKVNAPAKDNTLFVYNGESKTYNIAENDLYDITGVLTKTNVGSNDITISLKDKINYIWNETNNNNDLVYTFSISNKVINNNFKTLQEVEYTKDVIKVDISESDYYEISGNNSPINTGIYVYTISLKDKNSYIWSDGSKDDIEVTLKITPKLIDKPKHEYELLTYSGLEQTYLSLTGDEPYRLTLNSPYKATNPGLYSGSIELIDKLNYAWSDGLVENLDYSFEISKNKINKPEADNRVFTYTGSVIEYLIKDNDYYVVKNNKYTEPGVYSVIVELKGNEIYTWDDGTSSPLSYEFKINKKALEIPYSLNDDYTYNFKNQTFEIAEKDSEYYNITSKEFKDSGNYTVTYSIKNTNCYMWSDLSTSDKSINFNVKKLKVEKKGSNESYPFDNKEHEYSLKSNEFFNVSASDETPLKLTLAGLKNVIVSLTDTSNLEWNDGSTNDLQYTFSITKITIDNPISTKNSYVYTGSEIEFEVIENTNYKEYYTLTKSKLSQVEVGEYTYTYNIKDEYLDSLEFSNSNNTLTFNITHKIINTPTKLNDNTTYTGNIITFESSDEFSDLYTLSGDLSGTNVGEYVVTYTIKDPNYLFNNNLNSFSNTFKILKLELDRVLDSNNIIPYNNGENVTYIPVNFNETYMTITGNIQSEVGSYNASVSLNNSNVKWKTGSENDTIAISFTISADSVSIPLENQKEFRYTGESQSYFGIEYTNNDAYIITNNERTLTGVQTVTVSLKEGFTWAGSENNRETKTYTFEILPKKVSIPSLDNKYTYNGELIALDVSDTLEYKVLHNGTKKDVGSYKIEFELKDKENYIFDGENNNSNYVFNYEIIKRKITITTPTIDFGVYDRATHESTDSEVTSGSLATNHTLSYNKTSISHADTITNDISNIIIKDELQEDVTNNYDILVTRGTLTLNKINISLKAKDITKVYNPSGLNFDALVFDYETINSAFLSGTSISNITTNLENKVYDRGNYKFKIVNYNFVSSIDYSADYNIEILESNLTIERRGIDAPTFTNTSFVYNGSKQTFIIDLENVYSINNGSGTNVGEYHPTIVLNDNYKFNNKNEDVRELEYTFTITPKEIDKPTLSYSEEYIGTSIKPSVSTSTYYNAVYQSDSMILAGEYSFKFELTDKNNTIWKDSNNSNLDATFTITKKPITVELNSFSPLTYNEKVQSPTRQVYLSLGSLALGDSINNINVSYNKELKNVGEYTATLNSIKVQNSSSTDVTNSYNITISTTTKTVTINPLDVKVSIKDGIKAEYSGSSISLDFLLPYIKFDKTLSKLTITEIKSAEFNGSSDLPVNSGTYSVKLTSVTSNDSTNYNLIFVASEDVLDITKKKIDIPDGLTIKYDGKSHIILEECDYYDIINNPTLSNEQTNAGTYEYIIKAKDNYIFTDGETTKTITSKITKRNVVIKPTPYEYTYKEENYSYSSGEGNFEVVNTNDSFVDGEKNNFKVNVIFKLKGTVTTNLTIPNTYTIVIDSIIGDTNNYNFTFEESTLIVKKKDISIILNGPLEDVGYSSVSPSVSDTFTIYYKYYDENTKTELDQKPTLPGSYSYNIDISNSKINGTDLLISDCYNVSSLKVTYEITKTIIDYPVFNTTLREFTYNGESHKIVLSQDYEYSDKLNVTYDKTEFIKAGTYTVTVSIKDKNQYCFNLGDGNTSTDDIQITYKINKLEIDIPNKGETEFTYENNTSYTFVNSSISSYITASGTGTTSQTNSGTYYVTYSLNNDSNYDSLVWSDETTNSITYSYKIKPMEIEVPTAETKSLTYSGSNQTFEYQSTYEATNDFFTVKWDDVTINSKQISIINSGQYTLVFELKDKTNFVWKDKDGSTANVQIVYTMKKLKIEKPTIGENAITFTYEKDSNHNFKYLDSKDNDYYILSKLDKNGIEITPINLSQENAGTYNVTIKIDENCIWNNFTVNNQENVVFTYTINKARVDIPTVRDEDLETIFNDNSDYSVDYSEYISESDFYDITLNDESLFDYKQLNAGTYKFEFSLKDTDNYCWNDSLGTHSNKSIEFKILPKEVTKPTQEQVFTFDPDNENKKYSFVYSKYDYLTVSSDYNDETSLNGAGIITIEFSLDNNHFFNGMDVGDIYTCYLIVNPYEIERPDVNTLTKEVPYNGEEQIFISSTFEGFENYNKYYVLGDDSIDHAILPDEYYVELVPKNANYVWKGITNPRFKYTITPCYVDDSNFDVGNKTSFIYSDSSQYSLKENTGIDFNNSLYHLYLIKQNEEIELNYQKLNDGNNDYFDYFIKDAGEYNFELRIVGDEKDYYRFSNDKDTISFKYTINKKDVIKPEYLSEQVFDYNQEGTKINYSDTADKIFYKLIYSYNGYLYNADNTNGEVYLTNSGNYYFTISLLDNENYKWSGSANNSDDLSFNVTINRKSLNLSINKKLSFDYCNAYIDFIDYDSEFAKHLSVNTEDVQFTGDSLIYYTVTGSIKERKSGLYTFNVTLIDPSNYYWVETGDSNSQIINVEIKGTVIELELKDIDLSSNSYNKDFNIEDYINTNYLDLIDLTKFDDLRKEEIKNDISVKSIYLPYEYNRKFGRFDYNIVFESQDESIQYKTKENRIVSLPFMDIYMMVSKKYSSFNNCIKIYHLNDSLEHEEGGLYLEINNVLFMNSNQEYVSRPSIGTFKLNKDCLNNNSTNISYQSNYSDGTRKSYNCKDLFIESLKFVDENFQDLGNELSLTYEKRQVEIPSYESFDILNNGFHIANYSDDIYYNGGSYSFNIDCDTDIYSFSNPIAIDTIMTATLALTNTDVLEWSDGTTDPKTIEKEIKRKQIDFGNIILTYPYDGLEHKVTIDSFSNGDIGISSYSLGYNSELKFLYFAGDVSSIARTKVGKTEFEVVVKINNEGHDSTKYYNDGSDTITINGALIIEPIKQINKPLVDQTSEYITYDGESHNLILDNVSLSNADFYQYSNTSYIDVGIYKVDIYPKDGYAWSGDDLLDTSKCTLTWSIIPRNIIVQANVDFGEYDGRSEYIIDKNAVSPVLLSGTSLASGDLFVIDSIGSKNGGIIEFGKKTSVNTYISEDGFHIYNALSRDVTRNYNVTLEKGTATYKKKPLTVRIADVPDKVYDGTFYEPQEVTFEGLIQGHSFSYDSYNFKYSITNDLRVECSLAAKDIEITYNGNTVTDYYDIEIISSYGNIQKRQASIKVPYTINLERGKVVIEKTEIESDLLADDSITTITGTMFNGELSYITVKKITNNYYGRSIDVTLLYDLTIIPELIS